jgi:hypothetical protein
MRSPWGRWSTRGFHRASFLGACLAALPLLILAVPPKTQQSDDEIFAVVCVASVLGIIFLWIWPAIWMYRDAKRRRKEGTLWLLIGILAPVIGPVVWLVVRDDPGQPQQPAYYYPPPAYYYPPPQYQQQYNPYERAYFDTVEVVEVDTEEGYNTTRYDPYRRY